LAYTSLLGDFGATTSELTWRRWIDRSMDRWIDAACCLRSRKHRPGYCGLLQLYNHSLVSTKLVQLPFREGLAVNTTVIVACSLICCNVQNTIGNHHCAMCRTSPGVLFGALNRLLRIAHNMGMYTWKDAEWGWMTVFRQG